MMEIEHVVNGLVFHDINTPPKENGYYYVLTAYRSSFYPLAYTVKAGWNTQYDPDGTLRDECRIESSSFLGWATMEEFDRAFRTVEKPTLKK